MTSDEQFPKKNKTVIYHVSTALLSLLHLITGTISANKTVCVVKENDINDV